jgi:phosphonate transport system permease protein
MIASLFPPWLQKSDLAVSGYALAQSGFYFLYALLPVGALAIWQRFKGLHQRPLPVLAYGVTGLLIFVLFFSIVVNSDTAVLALRHNDATGWYLRFKPGQTEVAFSNWAHIGIGVYLALLGPLLIYLSALTRPRHLHPKASVAENCLAEPDAPIDALTDLRASWRLKSEYIVSLAWMLSLLLLICTYVWCGISPQKLWENRGNAKEYLFGRDLSEADRAYIEDQTKRAASIEAQGRARAFQDNKYRGIPVADQPTLEAKFRENEQLTAKFLSEMTAAEKTELSRKARQAAFEEKQGGYFPPESAWPKVKGYLTALLETVAIAIWGTLLAIVCAVPVSLFAAKNTLALMVSGEGRMARAVRTFCIFGVRRFLDACRGFNEFVMALIFVAVIGLGPYAGILALWIHTFGILGKVFSEQIEAIEGGQMEALSSTGAGVSQVISFAVLPQVMPGFVSYTLLRFESNVRSAAILGFVGAGGIGFLIFDKLNGYLFREVCSMMIIIIIAVGIIDYFCGKLRGRFI